MSDNSSKEGLLEYLLELSLTPVDPARLEALEACSEPASVLDDYSPLVQGIVIVMFIF